MGWIKRDVDGRDKHGHDGGEAVLSLLPPLACHFNSGRGRRLVGNEEGGGERAHMPIERPIPRAAPVMNSVRALERHGLHCSAAAAAFTLSAPSITVRSSAP